MTIEQKGKKRKGIRILYAGLALSALGLGTWYMLSRNKNKKNGGSNADNETEADNSSARYAASEGQEATVTQTATAAPRKRNTSTAPAASQPASEFPLKKGSKGDKVKALQQMMISRFGKEVLPKYGADGYFGAELVLALQANKVAVPVTEEMYTKLTQPDPDTLAKLLKMLIEDGDFGRTLAYLKFIQNVENYKKVGPAFRTLKYNGVETSLPTAVLRKFTDKKQQEDIDNVFTKVIGLKGNKDSGYTIPETLTGVGRLRDGRIITATQTQVWARARHPLSVGPQTILGREVSSSNGITEFETIDGYHLFVITDHVRLL